MLRLGMIGRIILISLAVVVPGGVAALAGLRITKYLKSKRRKDESEIHTKDNNGSSKAELQGVRGCQETRHQEVLDDFSVEERVLVDTPTDCPDA